MKCSFQEFDKQPVGRRRRVQCSRCGRIHWTTAHRLDRVSVQCQGGVFAAIGSWLTSARNRFQGIPVATAPKDTRTPIPSRKVIVPQPPEVQITPKSDRCVLTVAHGKEAHALLHITRPYMEAFARRVGADFHVSTWEGNPAWPMSCKFGVASYAKHYKRTFFCDADVLMRPGCVDPFTLCDPWEFGLCDELPWVSPAMIRTIQGDRAAMGFRHLDKLPWSANTGTMIIPGSHAHLLLPPTTPIPATHIGEQNYFGARVLDSGLPYKLLDRRANWQWWTPKKKFQDAPEDAILHFSGHRGPARIRDLQIKADAYPLDFDPGTPVDPAWAMDRRHVEWIHRVLLSGRFDRVLESGCHLGYSTQAALDALRLGKIKELHLCDVHFTDAVRGMAEDTGAILHEESILTLLARDSAFDLAIVDDDHTLEHVTKEAELLLASPTLRGIIMHDFNATRAGWEGCEGAQHLGKLLTRGNWRTVQDAMERPGEMTHRGLMMGFRGEGASANRDFAKRCRC